MRRSIDFYSPPRDEALESSGGDEIAPMSWVVAVSDDYDDARPRLVLTVEEMGHAGYGLATHLDAPTARRLRRALGAGLAEIGEAPDDPTSS